jgi:autotransporter translocation and assembly factor TamB
VNGRAKSWLKWTLVTIAATTAAITVAVALVIGTESGTRWLLGRVTAFAPVTISADQASGTLLTTLSIPSLAYEDAARVVRVADIALNIDWSQTGLSEVVIDSLLVRQVRVSNLQTAPTDPTLLEVSMPALPIGIRAAEVALRSLDIDETSVQDISVVGFAASGLELGAISADGQRAGS